MGCSYPIYTHSKGLYLKLIKTWIRISICLRKGEKMKSCNKEVAIK